MGLIQTIIDNHKQRLINDYWQTRKLLSKAAYDRNVKLEHQLMNELIKKERKIEKWKKN